MFFRCMKGSNQYNCGDVLVGISLVKLEFSGSLSEPVGELCSQSVWIQILTLPLTV